MNFLRKFMYGRYGVDHLTIGLVIIAIILTLISSILNIFFDVYFLTFFDLIPLIWAMFRIFSKNIYKRSNENKRFLLFWKPLKSKIHFYIEKFRYRKEFKYLKCPKCKTKLRVPRLNGKKIAITCKKCTTEFTTKS